VPDTRSVPQPVQVPWTERFENFGKGACRITQAISQALLAI
jgi:hypothetical protein